MFATLSLVLSAMQVVVSIPAEGLGFIGMSESGQEKLRRAFWVFSTSLIITSSITWVLIVIIPLCVLVWQMWWGFVNRDKVKEDRLTRMVGA